MKLKIIKLNKTHKLFHNGCTHGIRFNYMYDPMATKLRRKIRELYGLDSDIWMSFTGKTKYPYWIGVKDESHLTMLALSL